MAIDFFCAVELPAPVAPIADPFVFLIREDQFTSGVSGNPLASIGTNPNAFANGGGDLQVFSDAGLTNRLPIEVVEFVTGVSPSIIVWGRRPDWLAVGDPLYFGRDDTQVVQPPVTDTYGRNSVYTGELRRFPFGNTGTQLDVTGNEDVTLGGSGDAVASAVASFGESTNLNATAYYVAATDPVAGRSDVNLTGWIRSRSSTSNGIIGAFNQNSDMSILLYTGFGSKLYFRVYNGASTQTINSTTVIQPNEGDFHFSANYDGSELTLSINAIEEDSAAFTGVINSPNSAVFEVGRFAQGNTRIPDADFQEFIIRPSISSGRRVAEYNNQSDPTYINGVTIGYQAVATGGISIDIDTGLLSLIGGDLGLAASRSITTDGGVISLAGSNLSLLKSSIINLDTGVLSFIGGTLSLTKDNTVFIGGGSLSLTGGGIDIIYTPAGGVSIELDTGLLSLVGSDLSLSASRIITPESGDITLNGSPLSLSAGKSILIDTGNITLNGSSLDILKRSAIDIDSGDLSLTGSPIQLTYSGFVSLVIDDFSLSYTTDTIGISYTQDLINLNYE